MFYMEIYSIGFGGWSRGNRYSLTRAGHQLGAWLRINSALCKVAEINSI